MKTRINYSIIAACTILLLINVKAISQKSYLSIETGMFYGGPANDIENGFRQNGFADTHYWVLDLYFLVVNGHTTYPKTSIENVGWKMRYARELKHNKTIEVSFGQVHKSEVKGFDAGEGKDRYLNFKNNVSLLSTTYMFNSKKKSIGVGAGPVLAFYKLDISGYTEGVSEDSWSTNHTYLQPGITVTGFWRFVNTKIFFMDLRSGITMLLPAKTSEVSNKEGAIIFPSVKANHFYGDITIGAGIKF